MTDPRERMAQICRIAFDRKLLDTAGGNVTVRVGDRVYMSRSYSGGKWQWQVGPEDFLVLDMEGQILAGEGEFSREGAVHMACYHAFPEAGCVFHAHPLNIMPFVSTLTPIPPTSEQTDKFGIIGFCEHAPTHTTDLAEKVVAGLRLQAEKIPKHPIATLIPRHGIFVVGANLETTFDALERIDRSAYYHLMGRLLAGGG
jgi:ribulose-5-phosphate 4-epimerase/fuculose-1-phosphate aldolase